MPIAAERDITLKFFHRFHQEKTQSIDYYRKIFYCFIMQKNLGNFENKVYDADGDYCFNLIHIIIFFLCVTLRYF